MGTVAPTPRADVPDPPSIPPSIRRAGVLVALQGAALVVVAAVLTVRAAGRGDGVSGYGLALWFVVLGGGLLAAGVALGRGRRGGRGPATIAQVLLGPVAYYLLTSGQPLVGLALGALAALTLGQLFSRSSAQWMDAQYLPLPSHDPAGQADPAGPADPATSADPSDPATSADPPVRRRRGRPAPPR